MSATTPTPETTLPRVLFVDDSKLMRLSARKILGETFDIGLAENVEQALEQLNKDPTIQVVFSDLNMPGQSGYELLTSLRQSHQARLRDLPVVIITSVENQERERQRALDLGATDFIGKPFKASELMARARAHASFEEAERRIRQLEASSSRDPATGVGSSAYCVQRLDQALSFARRHDQPLSLIHLQLEGLERLLDELGKPFSTQALARIGQTLNDSIRREDTVYRTSVEHFTFLLPATGAEGAETLRNRFLPDLEALGLRPDGGSLNVTSRLWVQPLPLDGRADAESLLAEGLEKEQPPSPRPEPASNEGTQQTADIERALALLAQGETEAVRAQLPDLLERLAPLLELARERARSARSQARQS